MLNDSEDGGDRLYKISPFICLFNAAYGRIYTPGEEVSTDESLIPFRIRLSSASILLVSTTSTVSNSSCYVPEVVILAEQLYTPTKIRQELVLSLSLLMKLMDGSLDKGRRVALAEILIQRKTHLIVTVSRNRKSLPRQVTERKPIRVK